MRRPIRTLTVLAALIAGAGLVGAAAPATAATGDIGYRDRSFSGVVYPPTSDKPQSKLWYTDGFWWADLFDSSTKSWRIFRLDRPTQQWVDTGTANDTRPDTLADTLWDGSHLYIASHVVTVSTDSTPQASRSGQPAKLYRYSYSAATKTFSLDSGFPSTISGSSSESMTIDEDSTHALWATWTQVTGSAAAGWKNAVYVATSTNGGATWGTPFTVPSSAATTLAPDDISAVVAYGKKSIGVMWTNQNAQTVNWGIHADGAAAGTWKVGQALKGNKQADDHLDLKAIQADTAGRVFAAVKTSADELPGAVGSDPQIRLLVFKPATGSWSAVTFGTIADCHTRPQVVLDENRAQVHVFATGPSTSSGCPGPGTPGTIYEKTTSMDSPSFASGRGTPVIRDAADANMNNVTTTKQPVNAQSGLVVLASNTTTGYYWHADESLGTRTDASTPSTPSGLTATAASGTQVDLSWKASVDDVGVSGYRVFRNGSTTPLATVGGTTLTYSDRTATAGTTSTYQVAAVDAAGHQSATASASVRTPSGGATTTLTFPAVADTTLDSANPSTNSGTGTRLVADGSPATAALLKFTVTGTSACTVTGAKLRLTVGSTTSDDSVYGGDVYGVSDDSWSESTATWNTRPAAGTTKVSSVTSAVVRGASSTWDVTPLVPGDGTVSLQLATANGDAAKYFSREGGTAAQAPQLQVTCDGGTGTGGTGGTGTAPTAAFTAAPTSGTAPLPVSFTDSSTGAPTSWSWTFGDGGTSTAQNPSHTYDVAGTYTVRLTAGNASGSGVATSTVTVQAAGGTPPSGGAVTAGASATAVSSASSTAVSVPRPSGVATGDVIVAEFNTSGAPTASAPSGWTAAVAPVRSGSNSLFAYSHVVTAAASEPATYAFTLSGAQTWNAGATTYHGVDTAVVWDTDASTRANTTAATTVVVPGLTTATPGALVIGGVGVATSGYSVAPPTGFTEEWESSGARVAEAAHRAMTAAGATGNATFTLGGSRAAAGWLRALRPA